MDAVSSDAASLGEVLVVDDTPEVLAYLCELLGKHGYAVRAAPSGELALWSAASRRPDLILLDIRMPGIDGFQVCRCLKADPSSAEVPVIFLSAQSDIEDKVNGFRAGGVDFVGKPFASEEVLHRVATHISLARVTRELADEKALLEDKVRLRTQQLNETTRALQDEVVAHRTIVEQHRLAASAFDASLTATFITDAGERVSAVNPAFTALLGYERDECIGQRVDFVYDNSKNNPSVLDQIRATATRDGCWRGEIWIRRKDGNEFPSLYTLVAVRDDEGQVVNYVGVFLDLSESKDAQTLIEFLTHHDPLTGLPNRILVRDRFARLSDDTNPGEIVAVVCINLDRFRHINDFHGYSVGNEVLQWAAGQLTECMPGRDTLFRESGDEFVLVHRESGGLLGLQLLLETIQARINTELSLDSLRIAISVSLGVALYPSDGESLEDLVANAALAMARVKEQGGGSHAFFTEALDQGVRRRFDLAQRLRYALERNEFSIHYQPQFDAQSGRLVSAEALLRWHSPELGFVSPGQFIPVAEKTGCIVDIGAWVLRTVCLQIASWHAAGMGWLKAAVNLSAHQFMQLDIDETVERALADSGIPPACLELEITESAIIDDVQRAISTMHKFKALGISMSLDDFGTGYSSLSYLKKFPIDYLKIDQSFVHDLIAEPDADAIVLSIIGLAHNMRMQVIAEGVETREQFDFLAANRCDLVQGYLLGKPLPREKFEALLLEQCVADRNGTKTS